MGPTQNRAGPFLFMNLTPIKLRRFWDRVSQLSDCWEWTGCRERKGYGRIKIGGSRFLAHRLSWILQYGEIPVGFQVCHSCDNPSCVRPDHLFLGSNKENSWDKCCKGRQAKGEKIGCAKLTESQVREAVAMKSNQFTHRAIARYFSVDHKTIGRILNQKGWLHVTNPEMARDRFEFEVSKILSKPVPNLEAAAMIGETIKEIQALP